MLIEIIVRGSGDVRGARVQPQLRGEFRSVQAVYTVQGVYRVCTGSVQGVYRVCTV